jgi:hypothetical protein
MGNEKLQQNNPTNRRFIKRVNVLNQLQTAGNSVLAIWRLTEVFEHWNTILASVRADSFSIRH